MNTYYAVDLDKLEKIRIKATTNSDQPHENFHYAVIGDKAIVQAEWLDEAGVAAIGEKLGKHIDGGLAEAVVVEKVGKVKEQQMKKLKR